MLVVGNVQKDRVSEKTKAVVTEIPKEDVLAASDRLLSSCLN